MPYELLNAYSGPIIRWYSALEPPSGLGGAAAAGPTTTDVGPKAPNAEARLAVALVAWMLRKLSFEYSAAPATEAVTASNTAAVIIRFIREPPVGSWPPWPDERRGTLGSATGDVNATLRSGQPQLNVAVNRSAHDVPVHDPLGKVAGPRSLSSAEKCE